MVKKKITKKNSRVGKQELEKEIEAIEDSIESSEPQKKLNMKASKPISQIKKETN